VKEISRMIFYLIVAGVLLVALKEYFVQKNFEKTSTEEVYGWYYTFGVTATC
jgi:hypothetical protein